jgi:hypothetical protein
MLYSLANLIVIQIASKDSHRLTLNCVHFAEDGSTVATN